MACPTCGAPDRTDLSAGSKGLVLKAEAARMARRSATWINDRVRDHELETAQFAGRTYVVRSSLEKLLSVKGYPSAVDTEIERLLATNQPYRAQELHRRAYSHAYAPEGLMPVDDSIERNASISPGEAFVRKFGG